MKPEIYELDGVKRCKIKINDHETVDRVATDQDLLDAAEAEKQEKEVAKAAEKAEEKPKKKDAK